MLAQTPILFVTAYSARYSEQDLLAAGGEHAQQNQVRGAGGAGDYVERWVQTPDHLDLRIDPRLHFDRNYNALRPHTTYCEEIIYLE